MLKGWYLCLLLCLLTTQPLPTAVAQPPTPAVPSIIGLEHLASWKTGGAQADMRKDPLVVACFGDSNTEAATYTMALRDLLQGCYGDHGIGYLTFNTGRSAIPRAPQVKREGQWKDFDTSPGRETPPPPPYYAMDGFWASTSDANASVNVQYPDYPAGVTFRIRIHYQVGPGLGSFSIFTGKWKRLQINCAADQPGYALTEPFLANQFRLAEFTGPVTLLGFDADRTKIVRGESQMPGGALVHALGNGWGMSSHLSPTDERAFKAFFDAVHPDLITILLGTNDMHNAGAPKAYREHMTTIIEKMQRAAPGVGILVVSCPEAGFTKDGFAQDYASIAREVAVVHQCAFWDWRQVVGARSRHWEMMGNFGDGLHYNYLGGDIFAHLLLSRLGFDLNDLHHWPALLQLPEPTGRQEITIPRLPAMNLEGVTAALKNEPVYTSWNQDAKAADLQLAVAGSNLAVHARVYDGRCLPDQKSWEGSNLDLYVSKVGSWAGDENEKFRGYHGIVRQLVLRATSPDGKQASMHESGKDAPAIDFPWRVTPQQPAGYEIVALIPFSALLLDDVTDQFYLESAVVTAPGPGAPSAFNRLFLRGPDGGAFRDNTQFALVKVKK
ncbi:MAG: GDSL-type esterase/lipase family protein [Armatimonadota bacterium]